MLSFRASVFTNHCGGPSLSTPSPLLPINIAAFDERISSRIYFTFSYVLCEVRSSEARSLDQDQVRRGQGRFENADVKKQHADHTPTINTRVNITKKKLPDVIAKGRFMKADVTTQNAENTPPINTHVNIVTGNIKNSVKNKPWSALYGLSIALECPQVPTNPSHNPLD